MDATTVRDTKLFGSMPRPPRPVLLIIVYGLFLVIIGLTAVAQTIIVSVNASTSALNATIGNDAATIQMWANGFLRPSDLAGTIPAERRAQLVSELSTVADRASIARIEVRDPTGRVLVSNASAVVGMVVPPSSEFRTALAGRVSAEVVDAPSGLDASAAAPIDAPTVIREYFPLVGTDGIAQAVVCVWRDAAPVLRQLDQVRRDVVIVTLSAGVLVAVLLYLIFRAAQNRISRQTTQLVEATRRDPLTGTLNHGALVFHLSEAIESARAEECAIGVALVDIDGFRLFNETYGHEAGDFVLTQTASMLAQRLPETTVCGRYGPDEFLIVAPTRDILTLEASVNGIRDLLADSALQFDVSERLPLTISAGIAAYPDDGASVTELLSAVAVTLAEAKASGGDSVRVAGRTPESGATAMFDVLQGLIIAVDTKDRYTKRHCEDVARYGVFLGRQLGLDPDLLTALRTAGLLHDVGKIGIPDRVLRKPGKLTPDEYEIVKHHVALGDMIVRDLPNVDIIRDGVRHHHERWDGGGYLAGLAGADIPLIARILAVGDAFSAMTTTRPYRKALSIDEALRRLEDAAGTQLEERLVRAFVSGIETVPDAPMPGILAPGELWTPQASVA